MKFLIILLLLLIIVAIIAVRYRRQIQMAIYMWKMFRKMRRMSKADEKQIETTETGTGAPLVKCSHCGTWVTQTNALNLRSKTFYCSANCMEKAVSVPQT